MEILVSVLTGILAILTSVNMVGDNLVKKKIRSAVQEVDTVAVRIDNTPNYDAFYGKIQRVRIATRDLKLSSKVGFKVLELDIDRFNITLREFLKEDLVTKIDDIPTVRLRELFETPVRMGMRMVFTQKQLDNILQSETVNSSLSKSLTDIFNGIDDDDGDLIINSFVLDLIGKNRLALRMKITDVDGEYGEKGKEVDADLELSVKVLDDSNFEFFAPKIYIDGEEIETEDEILRGKPVTFKVLEVIGVNIGILQLNSDQDELELALFLRVDQSTASALLDAQSILEAAKLFLEQ
ncbi:MAG: LmeA family phospholipid-binding protein [Waterburya sp.]